MPEHVPGCVRLFVRQPAPSPAGRKAGTLGGELKLAVREDRNGKAHEGVPDEEAVELLGLEEVGRVLREQRRAGGESRKLEGLEERVGVEISPGLDDGRNPSVTSGGGFHLVVCEAFAHGVMLESIEVGTDVAVKLAGVEQPLVVSGRVRYVRDAVTNGMRTRERKGVNLSHSGVSYAPR